MAGSYSTPATARSISRQGPRQSTPARSTSMRRLHLPKPRRFLGAPPFQEDANDHAFQYINNVRPVNEQENLNLSLKGEWDVGVGTLTAIAAYNDQDNYFLTDGTSAAFFLYSLTGSCQTSNDARAVDSPLPAPFFYVTPNGGFVCRASCRRTARRPATATSSSNATRPTRASSSGSLRRTTSACAGWADSISPTSTATSSCRRVRTRACRLHRAALRTDRQSNPTDLLYDDSFTSTVYAAFGQLAFDATENVEVALALRYDNEDRDVDNNVPRVAPQTPGVLSGRTLSSTRPTSWIRH